MPRLRVALRIPPPDKPIPKCSWLRRCFGSTWDLRTRICAASSAATSGKLATSVCIVKHLSENKILACVFGRDAFQTGIWRNHIRRQAVDHSLVKVPDRLFVDIVQREGPAELAERFCRLFYFLLKSGGPLASTGGIHTAVALKRKSIGEVRGGWHDNRAQDGCTVVLLLGGGQRDTGYGSDARQLDERRYQREPRPRALQNGGERRYLE